MPGFNAPAANLESFGQLLDRSFHVRELYRLATLKVKLDHPLIPGQSHWLSGVYVDLPWRSRGIASSLCSEILDAARSRGVEQLYLQTERLDGGLYAKLGWMPLGHHHEEYGVEQLVMVKDLLPALHGSA